MAKKRISTAQRPAEDAPEEDELRNGHEQDDEGSKNHENSEEDEDMEQQSESDDEEEGDDDEEMEEDEDEDEKKESPSHRRSRDMALRSGKRKRARSKDTTGLTPEEKLQKQSSGTTRASKRARKSTAKAAAAAATEASTTAETAAPPPPQEHEREQQASEEPTPAAKATTNGEILNSTTGATPSSQTSPAGIPDPRRISYAAGTKTSDAARPDEEAEENEEDIPAPPPMNGGATVASYQKTTTVTRTQVVVETAAATVAAAAETIDNDDEQSVEETAVEEEQAEEPDATPAKRMVARLGFMTALALLFFVLHPLMVKLADMIIPLDASILPPKVEITDTKGFAEDEVVVEEVDLPAHEMEAWNANFQQRLEALQKIQENYRKDSGILNERYNHVQRCIQDLLSQVQRQEKSVQGKVQELTELESLLFNDMANEGEHPDQQPWQRVQSMAAAAGKPLLATSSIQIWNVPEFEEGSCANAEEIATVEDDSDEVATEPILTIKLLEVKESDLLLRAQMSAEKIMTGDVAKDRIRKWIAQTIDRSLKGDEDNDAANERISELSTSLEAVSGQNSVASSSGDVVFQSAEEIEHAIQARLEMDRADVTGEFDHASLKNGAEIIYGGRRGTSKSLIDYLPIYNRILQSSNLRFYGFGPEAALLPSYPTNALGHCWSFRPSSLEEQLKEREQFEDQRDVPRDFKRGSFGTLTISFATPVFVNSVVIEHIPQRLTDRADTAIRSFRVVGYEDEDATSDAWNLGSFEYSMQKNGNHEYLQEFEVATTSKGEDIPSLHSISLAVDSNWGHEYACLYRFRVHGEEDDDDD